MKRSLVFVVGLLAAAVWLLIAPSTVGAQEPGEFFGPEDTCSVSTSVAGRLSIAWEISDFDPSGARYHLENVVTGEVFTNYSDRNSVTGTGYALLDDGEYRVHLTRNVVGSDELPCGVGILDQSRYSCTAVETLDGIRMQAFESGLPFSHPQNNVTIRMVNLATGDLLTSGQGVNHPPAGDYEVVWNSSAFPNFEDVLEWAIPCGTASYQVPTCTTSVSPNNTLLVDDSGLNGTIVVSPGNNFGIRNEAGLLEYSLDFGTYDVIANLTVNRYYVLNGVQVTGPVTITCTGDSTILDVTAPVVTVPVGAVLEATGPDGAAFEFAATATDNADGELVPTCSPASGEDFALGTTTVVCSATDAAGNTGSAQFVVFVRDTTAPVVSVGGDVTAEATGPGGAVVTFSAATATDLVDESVVVSCDSDSGDLFPLGDSTVVCSATDAAGNTGSAQFTVTVQDTTAPVVTVPADIVVTATDAAGVAVDFTASANDVVDGSVPVACSPSSGSVFAIGITTVTCSASDSAGNSADGSFSVTVEMGGLEAIIDDLETAADNATAKAAKDLNKAIDHVAKALDELAETPPDVEKALEELSRATKDINKAVRDGYPASEAAAINAAIAEYAQTAAQGAIDDAVARNGNPTEITKAQDAFADALDELNAGDLTKAIEEFAQSAKHALKA